MPSKPTKSTPPRERESPAGYHFYSTYRECPRKHYLKYGLGLKPAATPPPLIEGLAFHQAIAWYYTNWDLPADELIWKTNNVYQKTIEGRAADYLRPDDYELGLVRGPLLLNAWHETWHLHDRKTYEVVEVENQRTLPLGPNDEFVVTIRPDRVFRDKTTGSMVLSDVKTTGYSVDAPFKQADAQDQITAYLWALARSEPEWSIEGAFIDVLFARKSRSQDPRKLFTEPKAERPGFIYRDQEALKQFELGFFGTILEVSQKYQNLPDFHPDILFPRNGKDCSLWSCEYVDVCRKALGPDDLPDGFIRDPWLADYQPQKPKKEM